MLIESIGNPMNHTGKFDLAKLELLRVSPDPRVPWKHYQANHSILFLGIERSASRA